MTAWSHIDDDLVDDNDSAEDTRIAAEVARQRRIERLYTGAWTSLRRARQCKHESGAIADHRIASCVEQVRLYRLAIARLRTVQPSDIDTILVRAFNDY